MLLIVMICLAHKIPDTLPLGAMRSNCSQDYLKRADAEVEGYLADARDDILQACREIVRTFS
jgi:hypothetical protein